MTVHVHHARKVVASIFVIAAVSSPFLYNELVNPRVGLSDVTGRVTYSGHPITSAFICLNSESGNHSAVGKLGADGTFRLHCVPGSPGAFPGLYHAYLYSRQGGASLPAKFRDPHTSGLEIDIAPGWSDLNIDLN
jgi:hypothetical protein